MKKVLCRILLSTLIVISAIVPGLPALASIPQEDPEVVVPEYNGISLYRYCSDSIDSLLDSNPDLVAVKLEKMPYANVPPSITVAMNDFADSMTSLSRTTVGIDKDLNELRELFLQSRLQEGVVITKKILGELLVCQLALKTAERAVLVSSVPFNISNLPPESNLKIAYVEVTTKLGQVRELLGIYQLRLQNLLGENIDTENILAELTQQISALGNIPQTDNLLSELDILLPELDNLLSELDNVLAEALSVKSFVVTNLSIYVNPLSAFVGDDITVSGMLQSEGKPLAGREIRVLLNNVQSAVIKTDASGFYETKIQVPYLYVPEMRVQTLYLPVNNDSGIYLSSISPEFKLAILYYQPKITIDIPPKSYPGQETICAAKLNYGPAIAPLSRTFEAYLDGNFLQEIKATEEFSFKINVSPDIVLGNHAIAFLSSAAGRYAPVEIDTGIYVTRAVPVLTMKFPVVIIVPGQINLAGTVQSEVGVLKNADIDIKIAGASATSNSTADGAFKSSVKMRMGLELLGSEPLEIQISPEEPWNDVLVMSRKVLLVNVINCGIFMVVVLFVGILLSWRLKGQIDKYLRRRRQEVVRLPVPEAVAPVYSTAVVPPELSKQAEETEPRGRVISLYISILRLMQRASTVLMKPNQTLREFATDMQNKLGPLALPFVEFTRIIERFLYSKHQVMDKDIEKSKQLTAKLQEGLK